MDKKTDGPGFDAVAMSSLVPPAWASDLIKSSWASATLEMRQAWAAVQQEFDKDDARLAATRAARRAEAERKEAAEKHAAQSVSKKRFTRMILIICGEAAAALVVLIFVAWLTQHLG